MKKLLNRLKKSEFDHRMERRAEQRHQSHFSILVNQHDESFFATIMNFSESGLGMVVPSGFAPHEPFELELAINNEVPLVVQLDVMSSQVVSDGFYIGAKLPTSCNKYAQFFSQMTQPRHGIIFSDH